MWGACKPVARICMARGCVAEHDQPTKQTNAPGPRTLARSGGTRPALRPCKGVQLVDRSLCNMPGEGAGCLGPAQHMGTPMISPAFPSHFTPWSDPPQLATLLRSCTTYGSAHNHRQGLTPPLKPPQLRLFRRAHALHRLPRGFACRRVCRCAAAARPPPLTGPPSPRAPSPLASRPAPLRSMRPASSNSLYRPAWASPSPAVAGGWQPPASQTLFARPPPMALPSSPQQQPGWGAGRFGGPLFSPAPGWQPMPSPAAHGPPVVGSVAGTAAARPGWQALVSRPPQAAPTQPAALAAPMQPRSASTTGMMAVPQAPGLPPGGSSYQRQMAAYRQRMAAAAAQAEAEASAAAGAAEAGMAAAEATPAAGEDQAAVAGAGADEHAAPEPAPAAEATLGELHAAATTAAGEAPARSAAVAPAALQAKTAAHAGAQPAAHPSPLAAAPADDLPELRSIRLAADRVAACACAIEEADRASAAQLAGLGLAPAGTDSGGGSGTGTAGGALQARAGAVSATLHRCAAQASTAAVC